MNCFVVKFQNLCSLVLVVSFVLLFSINSSLTAYDLPDFVLPYYRCIGPLCTDPYWSGGPHQWGIGPDVTYMDLYSGSGMDFANNGKSFTVLAMAEGYVEYVGQPNRDIGLGTVVAIRHTIGNSLAIYGHLASVRQEILDAYENDRRVSVHDELGQAGSTGTNNLHLHVELRDGSDTCCEEGHIGGNPISWHSLVIGNYRIFDVRPNELGIDPDGSGRQVAFNYDGVAIKVSDLPSELGPFGNNNFWFRDYNGELRSAVYTWLPSDFVCNGVEKNGTKNCELSTPRLDVVFANHGDFTGGGILYSDLEAPVDPTELEMGKILSSEDIASLLDEITPGTTTEVEVKILLGEPDQEVDMGFAVVLEYPSGYAGYPQKIHIKDGVVVLIKKQVETGSGTILDFLPCPVTKPTIDAVKYLRDYGETTPVYIYSFDGLAFVAHISDQTVFEVWRFRPTDLQTALNDWGQELLELKDVQSGF